MPVARRYIEQAWYAVSLDKSIPTPVEYVRCVIHACQGFVISLFAFVKVLLKLPDGIILIEFAFNWNRFNVHSLFHFTFPNPKLNNSNSFKSVLAKI